MIEFVDTDLSSPLANAHSLLNEKLGDGFQVIGHYGYMLNGTPYERYTLYKPDGNGKPQTALDELVLTTLVSFQRDETRNNARPMWRCFTNDDEPVNIFLNKDEAEKDSYQLFKAAGWGKFLDDFGLHQLRVDTHIQIAMKKNGRFWEVVKVRTKPQSDMPDWAKENYLFDEIVTEEDETEGGAE